MVTAHAGQLNMCATLHRLNTSHPMRAHLHRASMGTSRKCAHKTQQAQTARPQLAAWRAAGSKPTAATADRSMRGRGGDALVHDVKHLRRECLQLWPEHANFLVLLAQDWAGVLHNAVQRERRLPSELCACAREYARECLHSAWCMSQAVHVQRSVESINSLEDAAVQHQKQFQDEHCAEHGHDVQAIALACFAELCVHSAA